MGGDDPPVKTVDFLETTRHAMYVTICLMWRCGLIFLNKASEVDWKKSDNLIT
jgi:hypothetical protein